MKQIIQTIDFSNKHSMFFLDWKSLIKLNQEYKDARLYFNIDKNILEYGIIGTKCLHDILYVPPPKKERNKLKSIQISEQIQNYSVLDIIQKYSRYTDCSLHLKNQDGQEYGDFYDDIQLHIEYKRLETDDEYKSRIYKEKENDRKKALYLETKRKKALKEFELLKATYGF